MNHSLAAFATRPGAGRNQHSGLVPRSPPASAFSPPRQSATSVNPRYISMRSSHVKNNTPLAAKATAAGPHRTEPCKSGNL